jgi:hypothetical protein
MRADYSNSFNAPLQSASSSTSSIAARVKVYARRGPVWEVRKCARGEKESRIALRQSAILLRFHRHTEQINFAVLYAGPRDSRYSESMPPLLFFLVWYRVAFCRLQCQLWICVWCAAAGHETIEWHETTNWRNCCYRQIRRVNKLVVAARSCYQTCTECGQNLDSINTKTRCT